MKYLIFPLLILSSACGISGKDESMYNTPSRYLEISSAFTPKQQELVKQAMETWKQNVGIMTYEVSIVDNIDIENPRSNHIVVYPYNPMDLGFYAIGLTFNDYEKDDYFPIIISPIITDEVFLPTAIHELGHGFHLPHYLGSLKSIMHPYLSPGETLECVDVVDFCQTWDCQASCKNSLNADNISIKDLNFSMQNDYVKYGDK